jgi:cytoskeletal protein CcmA (bactofilin family)
MAIFNKSNQQTDYSSNITTIAAGSHVTGRIDIECELQIDGQVDAEINSTATIKIGQSGVVNGNLHAKTLILTGKFYGNADCEAIELVSGGEAEGKLTCASLTIDSSSSFQGESVRKSPGESSKILDFASEMESNKAEKVTSPFSSGKQD